MSPEEIRRRRALRLANQLVLGWVGHSAITPSFTEIRRAVEQLAQWLADGPTILDFQATLMEPTQAVQGLGR